MSRAYHVVGNLTGGSGQDKDGSRLTATCVAQNKVLKYFDAPDAMTAWVAARAIERIGKQAFSRDLPITCWGTCTKAQRANISTISPLQITEVKNAGCPRSAPNPTMCLTVSLLNGPRQADPYGMRGIVKRDGWYFQIELIDPLIGTDVVSYDRFVLKRVRANLMSQEGLDEVIP